MSRLQISENFGNEQLRTQASPIAQTEQVGMPLKDPRSIAIANIFGGVATVMEQSAAATEEADRAAAKKWAQSMTVSELGKQIESGHMMPSQSPVFVGTVQHIWGVNSHEAMARDITSKLTTGELKFNSPQEADAYLTEQRNTVLAGQSKYAVSGFDKGYAQLRDRVMDGVNKINDKIIVDNAQVQATDFLANSLNKVTSADFKGTPQEAASAVMQQYQLMRHTKTLPDAAAKAALGDVVTRMAGSGNVAVLGAFLDSEVEGGGSVRATLGETRAGTLLHQAEATFDQGQRKRLDIDLLPWYTKADSGLVNVPELMSWAEDPDRRKYLSSATIHGLLRANAAAVQRNQHEYQKAQILGAVQASVYDAGKRVDEAVRAGRLTDVQGTNTPKVITESGAVKDFDVKGHAEASLAAMTKGKPIGQQVSGWAMNGLENPDWRNTLNAGFLNLASVGLVSNGKPLGQLNDAGLQSIALFREIDAANPDYARQLVGEKAHERFTNIAFLMHLGRSADDAAGLAAGAASGAVIGSDVDKLGKKVQAEVSKLTDGHWYRPDWAARLMGDNTVANTAQVTGALRRYSTLLAHSGQYGDAEAAVSAAYEYLASPKVSARINGTLYLRSELPQAPASNSRTQDEWFERYINEVVKPQGAHMGAKASDIRMEYDTTAKAYRPYVIGLPMTDPNGNLVVLRRDEITKWYRAEDAREIASTVVKAQAYQRSQSEPRKNAEAAGEKAAAWTAKVQEAHRRGVAPDLPNQFPAGTPETYIPTPELRQIEGDWNYWKDQGDAARASRPGVQR